MYMTLKLTSALDALFSTFSSFSDIVLKCSKKLFLVIQMIKMIDKRNITER